MIATSLDQGESFEDDVYSDSALPDPTCLISAIVYNGLIDNQTAVLFSNAASTDRRIDGTVRIGFLK